jgi:hypothetical protein
MHRFKRPYRKPISQKPSELPMKNFLMVFKDILLVLVGGLVGVISNQFFYHQNRIFDADLELRKEIVKMQYPYLNRILNFSNKYKTIQITYFPSEEQPEMMYREGPQLLIETAVIRDTVTIELPMFVIDSNTQRDFMVDIEEIKKNKNYVDHSVWENFEKLIMIIERNPVPQNTQKEEVINSKWNDKQVQKQWVQLIDSLHKSSSELLLTINIQVG